MRKKLIRFNDNLSRENIIEPGKEKFDTIKGKWNLHFGNNNPIVLELGCGRGEYTVALAKANPNKNYIGVDIKGYRMWVGSTIAMEQNLDNVAFLRIKIQNIIDFFAENEVSEIWITFPDPRPKDRDEKRRLTHPKFLNWYRTIMLKEGWVKFKTDNTDLFNYTLELFNSGQVAIRNLEYTHDLYQSPLLEEHQGIKTRFEQMFSAKGETIKYMRFQFE